MEIEFHYNGALTNIQCNSQEMLNDAVTRFATKTEVNPRSLYMLCGGKIIQGNIKIETLITKEVLKEKKIRILLNDNELEISTPIFFEPKNMICHECGENAKINITEYKMHFQCKKGHCLGNLLFNESKISQKIDLTKIRCHKCFESNKGKSYQHTFFRCNACKINLCPICKNSHDPTHKVINHDEKDYKCKIHSEILTGFCETCKINTCMYCTDHEKHELINYKIPDINKENTKIEILKDKIKKVNDKINGINYEILHNFNQLQNPQINDDLDTLIKCNDINKTFQKFNEIYEKMTTKFCDELKMKYEIRSDNSIQLFGSEFVKNNKRFCKMIINKEQYDLKDIFNIENETKGNEYFEVTLTGIQNIVDMSYIFSDCSSLVALENISEWNTTNITDMSYAFNKCSSLKLLDSLETGNTSNVKNIEHIFSECLELIPFPDISNWNTMNVESMNGMFSGCEKIKSLVDISKWNTSKVKDMSDNIYY